MRLLDLFCGAGGAAMGYYRAGFTEIVGVDNRPMKRYPFELVQADALEYLAALIQSGEIDRFDLVHASPPCQRYSASTRRSGRPADRPDLIAATRALLAETGKPTVIENVVGSPLVNPIVLCGTLFPQLRVIRHRLFESNVPLVAPKCQRPHPRCYTQDKRKKSYGKLNEWTDYVQVIGGGNCTADAARDAMAIPWMSKAELNEAVPPPYTLFIGKQLVDTLYPNG